MSDKLIYCEECKKDITNERVRPQNHCFQCCMTLGSKAEGIFLEFIKGNDELIKAFNQYKHDEGLRTSALILD